MEFIMETMIVSAVGILRNLPCVMVNLCVVETHVYIDWNQHIWQIIVVPGSQRMRYG